MSERTLSENAGPEGFPEPLSRFTPDAGGLDRDALLFAAGRASARPHRLWMAVAVALAVTQVLTLVLLWPHPAPPAVSAPPPPVQEAPARELSDSPGLWSAHPRLRDGELDERPTPPAAGPLMDSGPPLRAFGPPPPSILN
jgi:hypothetical protein